MHGKGCAFADNAVNVYNSVICFGDMLNDGKPQPRAFDGFGMAFIAAEKPFINAVDVLFGNTNPRIGNKKHFVSQSNIESAAVFVVFYGVVAKIVNQFRYLGKIAVNSGIFTQNLNFNVLRFCLCLEIFQKSFCRFFLFC